MGEPAAIRLFWWAPKHSPRLLLGERKRLATWAKAGFTDGSALSNFGDALAPVVVKAVTGRRVIWSDPRRADLVAIGSVLDISIDRGFRGTVWGTGLRAPASGATRELAGQCNILAVRGALSASSLALDEGCQLGDPALLVGKLGVAMAGGSGPPVYVPHFTQMWSSGTQTVRRAFRTVRPTVAPLEVVHEVSRSSLVVASSLHGLIVAHAVGTPAVRLIDGVQEQEGEWKYRDYESSLGIEIPCATPCDVLDPSRFSELEERARDVRPKLDQRVHELSSGLARVLRDAF